MAADELIGVAEGILSAFDGEGTVSVSSSVVVFGSGAMIRPQTEHTVEYIPADGGPDDAITCTEKELGLASSRVRAQAPRIAAGLAEIGKHEREMKKLHKLAKKKGFRLVPG